MTLLADFQVPYLNLQEILDTRLQTLSTPHRFYRVAAHRFLAYLQTEFPQVRGLSQLRRDPHLLGWLGSLRQQDPPLSDSTRRIYLVGLRRLLHDVGSQEHPLPPELILPQDFPPRPQRPHAPHPPRPHYRFQEIFDAQIQILATTLRPSTLHTYRSAVHHFLACLQTDFPQLRQLSELRRDPHLCLWFRRLCEGPPRSNDTRRHYLVCLRRLLNELASAGHPLPPGLILDQDLPPLPQYLPRALSPEDDQRLQQELRRIDNLCANALLLTRATGIRIGECVNLALDCLWPLGRDQWALHVPLGKLYTERLVPADEEVRQLVSRILALRALAPPTHLARSASWLLPRSTTPETLCRKLQYNLRRAAERAGCSSRVTCHQLRHTFATEMLRLGVSLPALMQLLGHKDIRMTLRYVQVTQQDLQREFHLARQNAAQRHLVPNLPLPATPYPASADLPGIRQSLAATRHLLEMYRRQLGDEKTRRQLQRLDKRLLTIALKLEQLLPPEK
jgi:site-specific recombinase XerD